MLINFKPRKLIKFTGEGMDICVCVKIFLKRKKWIKGNFLQGFILSKKQCKYKSISAKEYNNEKYVEQN